MTSPTTPTAEGAASSTAQSRFESEVGHHAIATRKQTEHLLAPRSLQELHEDVLDLFAAGAEGDERVNLKPVGRRGYISVTVTNTQMLPARRRRRRVTPVDAMAISWIAFCLIVLVLGVIGVMRLHS